MEDKLSNELIVINNENALEVFTGEKLDDFLKAIEEDALNFVGDIETATGRKQIASKAHSIAKEKVRIDNVGKTLVEEWKKKSKLVDISRKKSRDFLDDLKVKVRQPLTEWEEEQERIEQEKREREEMLIAWEEAIKENELWEREKEIKRKEEEQRRIEEEKRQKEEAERLEKERIARERRIAQEAKEKAEREAQEKIEAAERAKKEAEDKAKADKERDEREKQEAIEQAKREEADRIAEEQRKKDAEEQRKKEEADRKAKHHAHIKKINREALEDLVKNGFDEEIGKKIITLIAKKKIRNLYIGY